MFDCRICRSAHHSAHATCWFLPAGMPIRTRRLKFSATMKGKIDPKKEVAEAVGLAKVAFELFDVNTADGLLAAVARLASLVIRVSAARCGVRPPRQWTGIPACAPNGRGCLPGLAIPRAEMAPLGPQDSPGLVRCGAGQGARCGRTGQGLRRGGTGQGRGRCTCAAAARRLGKPPSWHPRWPAKENPAGERLRRTGLRRRLRRAFGGDIYRGLGLFSSRKTLRLGCIKLNLILSSHRVSF
jgi:hypothetical protein